MVLTTPLALWLLLLVPVPLLLARRRRPIVRIAVSNLYLWAEPTSSDTARPTLRRIRRQWVVVAQMAFIAAVVFALARPTIASGAVNVAFVFDVSASMAARDAAGTRLEDARRRARSIANRLPRRSHVRLIAAAASPRDLGEYASDDSALTRALAALAPTGGPADLSAAVALTTAHGSNASDVFVFSDHRDAVDTPRAVWVVVGEPADNAAIVRIAARRLPLTPADGEVLIALRNYGNRPRDTEVVVTQDGQIVARRPVLIAPHASSNIVVPVSRIGQLIGARLTGRDALDIDDVRFTIVRPLAPVRVRLVGERNLFLEKALSVNRGLTVRAGGLDDGAADVVVCNGCTDMDDSRSGVLMIARSGAAAESSPLTIVRTDHPLTRALDFSDVFATPTGQRADTAAGEVIARAGGLPVIIAAERNGHRRVRFHVDLTRPDLALSPAFPVLIGNAIEWLAARDRNPTEVIAGEPVQWTLSDDVDSRSVAAIGPDGRRVPVQRTNDRVTIANTDSSGIYRVQTPTGEDAFVVNPAVDGESDLSAAAENRTPARDDRSAGAALTQRPLVGTLLIVATCLLAIEWSLGRGRPVPRVVIAASLLLSAAGLAALPREGALTAIAVLDRSASVPPRAHNDQIALVHAFASTMHARDRLGVVVFGRDPLVELRPSNPVALPAIRSVVGDADTDIAAALRVARGTLPRSGSRRIVLVSDGRETVGDAAKEAVYAAADGVRIDVVSPDMKRSGGLPVVTHVSAPTDVRLGEPFIVSIDVDGSPGARGELLLYRNDERLDSTPVTVGADGTANVRFSDRREQPGTYAYRASLRNADDASDDNSDDKGAGAVVSVIGRAAVLYVSAAADRFATALANTGFDVVRASPESLPSSEAALADYDAVLLDDIPADRLNARQMSAVADYVEQSGGGLLVLGGVRSLSVAGYPATPLEQVLPIDLRPRSGRQTSGSSLVVVFDKSGSMADPASGTTKIELARQAVLKVLDVLAPADTLGVIAFDGRPTAVVRPAADQDRHAVSARLRALEPGGATLIAPAVELALDWLRGAGQPSSRRQILLLSDGRTSRDDATRLRAAVAGGGIEVSVVATGVNADRELLTALAGSSGGRAYFPSDLAELPRILAREAARAASGTVVRERFRIRAANHPIVAGLRDVTWPELGGYVVGATKPTAAAVLASHLNDPILSAWHAGLGRAALFTADLASPWSSALRAWDYDAQLWSQVVRWVSRRTEDQPTRLAARDAGGAIDVSLDASTTDGAFLQLSNVTAIVRRPTGENEQVALLPSAPGRYEARIRRPTAGPYTFSASGLDATGNERRAVANFYWSADREHRFRGADVAFLARLAGIAGGRVLAAGDSPFEAERVNEYVDVSVWVLAAALALFLLDIAVQRRRSGWSAWFRARRVAETQAVAA